MDGNFYISIASLTISIATYLIDDKKLKKQQALINEYQIEKNKEEQEEKGKALIECSVVKTGGSKLDYLKIYNRGKATAFNINIEVLDLKDNIDFMEHCIPFPKLIPQQSFDLHYFLDCGGRDYHTIKITWDDPYKQKESVELSVNL